MVWGYTKIPGGECHRPEKGVWKKTMRFGLYVMFGVIGMDTGRCADELLHFLCTCAVFFPTEILEQMIVTSIYNITRFYHAILGGNIKRRAWPNKWKISCCCYYYCLGVLTQHLGLQQATDPLPWLSWCLLCRKHTQNVQCCLFFHKHASRPIWRTLSNYDFIYLTVTKVDDYLLPWNLVLREAWITTLR